MRRQGDHANHLCYANVPNRRIRSGADQHRKLRFFDLARHCLAPTSRRLLKTDLAKCPSQISLADTTSGNLTRSVDKIWRETDDRDRAESQRWLHQTTLFEDIYPSRDLASTFTLNFQSFRIWIGSRSIKNLL